MTRPPQVKVCCPAILPGLPWFSMKLSCPARAWVKPSSCAAKIKVCCPPNASNSGRAFAAHLASLPSTPAAGQSGLCWGLRCPQFLPSVGRHRPVLQARPLGCPAVLPRGGLRNCGASTSAARHSCPTWAGVLPLEIKLRRPGAERFDDCALYRGMGSVTRCWFAAPTRLRCSILRCNRRLSWHRLHRL
jgi:hypothetical protein